LPEPYRQLLNLLKPIVTGLPTTGADVFESMVDALEASTMPALALQPREEDIAELFASSDGPGDLEGRRLVVELVTLATSLIDRDDSALEVKTAVMQSGIGKLRRYLGTRFEERSEGDRITYALIQRFEFLYFVESTTPGVIQQG